MLLLCQEGKVGQLPYRGLSCLFSSSIKALKATSILRRKDKNKSNQKSSSVLWSAQYPKCSSVPSCGVSAFSLKNDCDVFTSFPQIRVIGIYNAVVTLLFSTSKNFESSAAVNNCGHE